MSPNHREEEINDSVLAEDVETRPTEAAIDDAAAALREVEVEAVQTDHSTQSTIAAPSSKDLDNMSIDDLRKLAAKLDIPDRGQIVEKDKLVAAIRQRM
jgi:hypothetical protein